MASNLKLANALVNAQAASMNAVFANGKLRIYDGTQAADADTAVGAQHLIAEFTLPATVWGTPSAGVVAANAITAVNATATYTATWFRVTESDGSTGLLDGNVGTSGCDLNLNAVAIVSGAQVSVTSWTHTVTK
jgi:hypothetical protein